MHRVQFPAPRPFDRLMVCDCLENGPEPAEGPKLISLSGSVSSTTMFFVYILKNPKGHIYVGCTKNTTLRVERHNSGLGAEFTKRNKDFVLAYSEEFQTLVEARRRERQIKGWRREKKENLIRYGVPNPPNPLRVET